ncbi:MAG: ABC transporter permease, partial [Thermodesulfobacteriota bacterium]
MNLSLIRIGLSHFKQHLIQSILLILGVAIGVAVIVSVDLANISANRSFELSTESIIGKTTHRIFGGPSGLDENLYSQLKVQLGLEKSAPVVQDYVTVVQLDRRPVQLIGLDPFAEKPFRNYLTDESNGIPLATLATFLSEPNSILVSEELARSSGLRPGTTLTLEYGSRSVNVRIVGLLKPIDDLSCLVLAGLI